MTIDLIRVDLVNDNIEEVLGEYNPSTIIIDGTGVPATTIAWAVFTCVKNSTNYKIFVDGYDLTPDFKSLTEAIKGYYEEIYN